MSSNRIDQPHIGPTTDGQVPTIVTGVSSDPGSAHSHIQASTTTTERTRKQTKQPGANSEIPSNNLLESQLPNAFAIDPSVHDATIADPSITQPSSHVVLKTRASELAINGGTPTFAEPLHVGRPNTPNRERLLERVSAVLDSGRLTNDGPYVREFERQVAAIAGVRHCIATSSGTSALEISAAALQLTGEVIVPAMTFIATPHAFAWRGLSPVFADIDADSCCIDPAHVEKLITSRTSAIVGVHLWGRPCDTDALGRIARKHNLKLLFDSSHAFGCSHQGQMIGSFGEAEVFSFHATKFIGAAEGGAVVTNSDRLADRLRRIRNFGFTDVDQVAMIGTNAKLNEISAAFGITSLEAYDSVVEGNRRTHEAYTEHFARLPGIRLREFDANERHNYQYLVAHVDQRVTGVSRDQLIRVLHAENALVRRYFYPGCHRSGPYGSIEAPCTELPVTDHVSTEVLCLPAGPSVSAAAVKAIARLIELEIKGSNHAG